MRKIVRILMALIIFIPISLSLDSLQVCSSVFPLDEEEVFCIYYGMEGGDFYLQDLEDLCMKLGRPSFTCFKPSEMFTKNTLLKLSARLREKIGRYDSTSLFKWTCRIQVLEEKNKTIIPVVDDRHKNLPHPTPFIRSELSKESTQSINGHIKSMTQKILASEPVLNGEIPFSVNIYLKPDRIAKRFHKRIIAHEDVFLPHRYVIFQSVRLEIISSNNPSMVLTAQDMSVKYPK